MCERGISGNENSRDESSAILKVCNWSSGVCSSIHNGFYYNLF